MAALLATAGLAVASLAAPPSLERLQQDYRAHRLATRPDLATRAGDRRGDARLEPVTQTSLAREAGWLADFARRLESVPRAGLAPAAQVARDSLAARLAATRAELEVTRRWERDPAAYLDLAGTAIRSLLSAPRSDCARARVIASRLRQVPEVLRAARVNLREPPRDLVAEALPGYERLLWFYRVELPAFALSCHEPRTQADLAEADTLAVRAAEDFLGRLREGLSAEETGTR